MTDEYNTDQSDTRIVFNPKPSVADVPVRALPVRELDESEYYAAEATAEKLVADGGCDSYQGTVQGNVGEMCVEDYLPGDRGVDFEVHENGDGGWDFKYGGLTWDVKTAGRHRNQPALIVDATKRLRADRYILANRIGVTACRIVGYAPRWVVKDQKIHLDGDQAYRLVPRDKLVPFPPVLSE